MVWVAAEKMMIDWLLISKFETYTCSVRLICCRSVKAAWAMEKLEETRPKIVLYDALTAHSCLCLCRCLFLGLMRSLFWRWWYYDVVTQMPACVVGLGIHFQYWPLIIHNQAHYCRHHHHHQALGDNFSTGCVLTVPLNFQCISTNIWASGSLRP